MLYNNKKSAIIAEKHMKNGENSGVYRKTNKWQRIILVSLVAILIASGSLLWLSKVTSSPDAYTNTIQYLDDKKLNVVTLAGAATAASLAISSLPGDAGTPIANELADLSGYFLLIVSAIVLEKYLLTVTGYVAFTWIIPIACIFLFAYAVSGNLSLRRLSFKLMAFGLVIFSLVPISTKISTLIEETYNQSSTQIVESVTRDTDKLSEVQPEDTENHDDSSDSWWTKFTNSLSKKVEELKEDITDGVADVKEQATGILSRFIDALAVFLVTSLVIPILTLIMFIWLTKLAFGIELDTPKFHKASKCKGHDFDDEEVSVGL